MELKLGEIAHSDIMVTKPGVGTFGGLKGCQVLLDLHKAFLLDSCADFGLD